MQIVDIYFYEGENGGAIQSPVKIAGAVYTIMYRLIADAGKILTNGTDNASVIDVTEADKASWSEIDKPQEGEITG